MKAIAVAGLTAGGGAGYTGAMPNPDPPEAVDADPPPQAVVAEADPSAADAPPVDAAVSSPPARRLLWPAVAAVALAVLALAAWMLLRPTPAPADPRQLDALQSQLDVLQQKVATLARSDQISREANRDLQSTLAERDEEIAGLRADVAFYERFVGATGQRRGLAVHQLQLQAQGENAWHFTATLTQNINRGAVSSGKLTLTVEGIRAGKLQRLSWADLRQQPGAAPLNYSFKYFQQVEADLLLPPGFSPQRVTVRLNPQGGAVVEQSFGWAEASTPAPGSAPEAGTKK